MTEAIRPATHLYEKQMCNYGTTKTINYDNKNLDWQIISKITITVIVIKPIDIVDMIFIFML